MKKLSKYEKETIINWNEAETLQRLHLQRQLEAQAG